MSQQDFEFQLDERRRREDRSINTDPREQRPPRDYMGAEPLGAQKIYPQSPRRRRRGLWGFLGIILLLVLLSGGAVIFNQAYKKSQALAEQSLHLAGTPTIIIDDAAGSVKIHKGSGDQIVLDATAHGRLFSNLSGDQAKLTRNANGTITISVVVVNQDSVDLDITLPQNSNIQANMNSGRLDIDGVSGLMNLKMDNGDLNYENGTLANGSAFHDNTGTITFKGSFAASGSYDFQNNTGAINLSLPSSASFTLDASANLGTVRNQFGTDTVGSNPASVTIHAHTNTGIVTIQPA